MIECNYILQKVNGVISI